MDFDSSGDRLEEIQISQFDDVVIDKESLEEVPKILSPEVHDVFHIFASMLDVKSFINLAMTSKEMYRRCTKDKSIKISVDMYCLTARTNSGSLEYHYPCFDADDHNYADLLCKLPCKINVRSLVFGDPYEEIYTRPSDYKYMKDIAINKIEKLTVTLDDTDWETIIAIIKEYGVKSLIIKCSIEINVLRSILQLNLKKLWCHSKVPIEAFLETDSPIPEIYFPNLGPVSKEELMELMSKIQTGSLLRFKHDEAVDWEEFRILRFDHEGPLPDDRPLLFWRNPTNRRGSGIDEYWFLHWHGGVTKCICNKSCKYLEIFKCEPWDRPYILRKEEDVLKDLAEKRPSVLCSSNQFCTFFENFTMIDDSHEGPLPEYRPLGIQVSPYNIYVLDEDDTVTECIYGNGLATWKMCDPFGLEEISHPALMKHMFWKLLKQLEAPSEILFDDVEVFDTWFDDVEKLDFYYSGPLPSTRPLVFERGSPHWEMDGLRVVLFDDRLIECSIDDYSVYIKPCENRNRPPILPILLTIEDVLEIIHSVEEKNQQKRTLNASFDVFRDTMKQLKESVVTHQNQILISEKSETEFWYRMDEDVRKVEWKEGCVMIIEENDFRESPPDFMKQTFKYFAEHPEISKSFFTMEIGQFCSCLEQFTVVPFHYSGPLKSDSPMAFVKKEVHHTYHEGAYRSKVSISVWFLWNGMKVTNCSWGKNEQNKVLFRINAADFVDIPDSLKSKEYLKNLLEGKYDSSSRFGWFGRFEDFYDHFKDHMKLHFDYDGPLSNERPLLFEDRFKVDNPVHCVLREDGTIIKCSFWKSSISLSLASPIYDDEVPPILKSMS